MWSGWLWGVGRVCLCSRLPRISGFMWGRCNKWLRQERIESGEQEGLSRSQSKELRDLRRRNRLLEQENEVLRRAAAYLSQANLPGKEFSRSSHS